MPSTLYRGRYLHKKRFISYWHQLDEITKLQPTTVLEIGVGIGLTSWLLAQREIGVRTIDIDHNLSPSVVGSATNLPFANSSFDVTASFQVLEHLPYASFIPTLMEMHRVCKSYCIISLPDYGRAYRINVELPHLGEIRLLLPIKRIRQASHSFDGEHYWEINRQHYPLKRILRDMEASGLKLVNTYRVLEHQYHRFFVLRKEAIP